MRSLIESGVLEQPLHSDWLQTAGVLESIDLLVSGDLVAHLAGALGIPTVLILAPPIGAGAKGSPDLSLRRDASGALRRPGIGRRPFGKRIRR